MNTEILKWIIGVPTGDINFKTNIDRANIATLMAALMELQGKIGSVTACKIISARIKKLNPAEKMPVDCQGYKDHRGVGNVKKGVKVPGNSGKCIRPEGPCDKAKEIGNENRTDKAFDTLGADQDAVAAA